MPMNDPLGNVLSHILNCEKKGFKEIKVRPVSNMIKSVLSILKDNFYIGDFEVDEKARGGGEIKINLLGNINKCGVIKPRFPVTTKEFEKFEKRFLPAKDIGIIIISTSKGIITLKEALDKNVGGKLIAYCY